MKILVTGGNGFIGSHLCDSLTDLGYDVTSLDLKFNSNTEKLSCEKKIIDISSNDSLGTEIKNSDLVIHMAAVSRVDDAQSNPINCFNVNVKGIIRILEVLKNSKTKLVFGSSREVYGEAKKFPVKETFDKNPLSVYGSSKLVGEQLLKIYRKLHGLNYVILRFSNVYGSPRDLPQRVIPRFADMAMKDSPLTINGGNQIIDFTFIDDVIKGITQLVEKISVNGLEYMGEDYNFSSETGTSVADLAKLIKKIFNSNSDLNFLNERSYDVQKFIGDYQKAKNAFSFEPRHSLKDGLEKYKNRL